MWNDVQSDDKPNTLIGTLKDNRVFPILFPNIVKIINILL